MAFAAALPGGDLVSLNSVYRLLLVTPYALLFSFATEGKSRDARLSGNFFRLGFQGKRTGRAVVGEHVHAGTSGSMELEDLEKVHTARTVSLHGKSQEKSRRVRQKFPH